MLQLPGYELIEQLHESQRTLVYRGRRIADNEAVIVKTSRSAQPSAFEAARLGAEYDIGKVLDTVGLVEMLALERDGERPAVVMRDRGGVALSHSLTERRLSLREALELAVELAQSLAALHRRGVIHKDINPANIVVYPAADADGRRAQIVDLGIASLLDREAAPALSPEHLEGTLLYISPEQTGRTGRSVDHRTDLYALGATIYELLAARPPFVSDEPIELVHAHIARTPAPPSSFEPSVPAVVDAMVLKLLAKSPDDRYHSAEGLAADLERCIELLDASDDGAIPDFLPGQRDRSARLLLPEKLYGRATELDRLISAFERAADGTRQLLALRGGSGVGKSALVRELGHQIIERGARMISGRFESARRGVPHAAFVEATADLVRQVLTEDEDTLARWRDELSRVLDAAQATLLAEVMPELRLLLQRDDDDGADSADSADGGEAEGEGERERRLGEAVRRAISVFASREQPLVMFLDDMHLADAASLRLTEMMLGDDELHHMLLIAAYRSDGVTDTHPWMLTLRAIEDGTAGVERLELPALDSGHVAQLLADTLGASTADVAELAELLADKTRGNPLFVARFLQSLNAEGLLRFDPADRRWRWDIAAIAERQIADNVVALLLEQMERMPEQTARMLEVAAVIGTRFDVGSLGQLAEEPLAAVVAALRPALREGIVRPLCVGLGVLSSATSTSDSSALDASALDCLGGAGVTFVHERFRQAAYTRAEPGRRTALHLAAARLLYQRRCETSGASGETPVGRDDKLLFDLVTHYEAAGELLDDDDERVRAAQLYLAAGRTSQNAVAFGSARRYYSLGVDALPERRWSESYDLTFELYSRYLDTLASWNRDIDDVAQRLATELAEHAEAPHHKLLARSHVIMQLARNQQPERAADLAIEALREVGIETIYDDPAAALAERWASIRPAIAEHSVEQLVAWPAVKTPEHAATAELKRNALMPLFMRRPELVSLAQLGMVEHALEHGVSAHAGLGFGGIGRVVAHMLDDYEHGYKLVEVGRGLAQRMGQHISAVDALSAGFVSWIKDSLWDLVDRVNEAFRRGVEDGEPIYSALSATILSSIMLEAGVPLDQLYVDLQPLASFIEQVMGNIGVREVHLTMRFIETLRGQRPVERSMFDDDEERDAALEVMRVRNREGVRWYHLLRSRATLLLGGDPRAALAQAREVDSEPAPLPGRFTWYDELYQRGALCAAAATTYGADSEERTELVVELEAALERLRRSVEAGAGVNLGHKVALLEAERLRLRESPDAPAAYERAIAAASESRFTHDLALTNELCGRYYLGRGLDKVARVYLRDARYAYEKWAATAKVRQLDEEFPELRPASTAHRPSSSVNNSHSTTHTVGGGASHLLDLASVFKASQAIASEVKLGALLSKLLEIIAQNAGAQRGALVLRRDGALHVEAYYSTGDPEAQTGCEGAAACLVRRTGGKRVEQSKRVPSGIVHFVARTRRSLRLDDAVRKGEFRSDAYVARENVHAVLASPLSSAGKLVGVVYLENSLPGAFGDGQDEIVEMLCGQAAISIENARLVSELEQSNEQLAEYSKTLEERVEARTRDLAHKNDELAESLDRERAMQNRLVMQEKMASLGNLVAGVAHEVNTPIGAVISATSTVEAALERLDKLIADSESIEALRDARRTRRVLSALHDSNAVTRNASERIDDIVRRLRNFARLDEAELKSADLREGIESTVELARHRIGKSIVVELDLEAVPELLCYPNQLNQVFMNLLINAVDAIEMRDDHGSEGAEPGRICVRTRADDTTITVEIEDNGRGMNETTRARIFDPGFTTKGVGVGTGLGLSIVFNIVEKHEGSIDVASAPGAGTTFSICLPLRAQKDR